MSAIRTIAEPMAEPGRVRRQIPGARSSSSARNLIRSEDRARSHAARLDTRLTLARAARIATHAVRTIPARALVRGDAYIPIISLRDAGICVTEISADAIAIATTRWQAPTSGYLALIASTMPRGGDTLHLRTGAGGRVRESIAHPIGVEPALCRMADRPSPRERANPGAPWEITRLTIQRPGTAGAITAHTVGAMA